MPDRSQAHQRGGPDPAPAWGPGVLGPCSMWPDDCPPKWMLELSESVLNRALCPLVQQMFTEPCYVPGVVLCPGHGGVNKTDRTPASGSFHSLPFRLVHAHFGVS